MITIREIKMKSEHTRKDLVEAACSVLKCGKQDLREFQIIRQSIDARKKPDIYFIYEVWVCLKQCQNEKEEEAYLRRLLSKRRNVADAKRLEVFSRQNYVFPYPNKEKSPLRMRPVIIGMGPAGLFCGLMLAKAGFAPILLERGACVDERTKDVLSFWNGGRLKKNSNVQFGEGGAGTFSDGKLNTLVKESKERHRYVLETFVKYGAPEDILYCAKPHIGTDVLSQVVTNIREEILACGGEVRFHHQVTHIEKSDRGTLRLTVEHEGKEEQLISDTVCLAIGHSARDTFQMLYNIGISMEAKPFAVGVRMEHPQKMIDESQYGMADKGSLPAAVYKLTAKTSDGRGVYSFCMCPGGYVVNASSKPGRLAVNGMSYRARDGKNANSAIIVTVRPEDFPDDTVLGGLRFQEKLEKAAYELADGKIPVQCYGDFVQNQATETLGEITPCIKGAYALANVRAALPEVISQALSEAIPQFGRKIRGYDRSDALMSAVESRTSSPIRILRDETLQSSLSGLFPCGEGAGYAGGITSAAIDGIRVAEQMAKRLFEQGTANSKKKTGDENEKM